MTIKYSQNSKNQLFVRIAAESDTFMSSTITLKLFNLSTYLTNSTPPRDHRMVPPSSVTCFS